MKLRQSVATRVLLAGVVALSFAVVPRLGVGTGDGGAAWAAQGRAKGDEARPKRKTKKVQTLSEKVFKKLVAAQELMEAEQYVEAREILATAQKIRRLKPYDRAMIHQIMGYSYSSQENYEAAIAEFEKLIAVGADAVPEGVLTSTLYNMSQMYMVLEKWQKGVDTLARWFKVATDPGPDPYILMAQGYAQLEEFKRAIPFAQQAIDMTKAQGKLPKENWYQLLMAMHFELQDYPNVAKILEILVKHYPKKNYWLQLAGVYGELGEEKKQLGMMEVIYEQGYFDKSSEYVNLAQFFLYHEAPYKAAKVLEKGLKDKTIEASQQNWELLANALTNAAEYDRSIPYLEKAAALDDNGELYVRLGQAHMQDESWNKAVTAFQKALDKGGLKRPGTAYLLLGMANFNADKLNPAKKAFRSARKNKKTSKTARQWLTHISRIEAQRRKQN